MKDLLKQTYGFIFEDALIEEIADFGTLKIVKMRVQQVSQMK